jgi:hypothetical protein
VPDSDLPHPVVSPLAPRTRKRKRLRLVGIAVSLVLFVFSFYQDWGYLTDTMGEFRAIERAGIWHAFDPGERPDIDGLRFVGEPEELPARTSLRQRLDRPVESGAVEGRYLEVHGTLRVDHSPLEIARHWAIPWIVRREPEFWLQAVEIIPEEHGHIHRDITERDLVPALPVIADYLDRHYAGTGLGEQLRCGPGVQHALDPRQLPILALQVLLLAASLALAAPWRWRRAPSSAGS